MSESEQRRSVHRSGSEGSRVKYHTDQGETPSSREDGGRLMNSDEACDMIWTNCIGIAQKGSSIDGK